MAIGEAPRLSGRRAHVWPHLPRLPHGWRMDAIGRASGLVWPHAADVTSDHERQGTSDELVLVPYVMSPYGRLLITKMQEHLR